MNDAATPDSVRQAWARNHVLPLWENPAAHGGGKGPERAHLWRWRDLEPLIEAAIAERSMAAVERRVLSLMSPHTAEIAGARSTTRNLNAGLQILMPGETARPHRHSMNALRFVMSGSGATTVVDGKSCPMQEGDLVTTPGWCWHEHVHKGDGPIVWLDVLDASLHRYLGTAAFEPGPPNAYPPLTADAAYTSANMVPVTDDPVAAHSPVFRYPWKEAANAVAAAPLGADGTRRVRYANPANGGPVMQFLDCWLVEIAAGAASQAMRSNASAVCCVVEGSGSTTVGADEICWSPRDVFSLPSGNWITHRAGDRTARLFVVSDREILRRLGLLQEETAART